MTSTVICCVFPEETPKQLDQDEIIEILYQSKAPECYEAMVNAKIDIFEIFHKGTVSNYNCLENLEKIRRTNGSNPASLPVEKKLKYFLLPVVWASLL
jgi:hypothetical protein